MDSVDLTKLEVLFGRGYPMPLRKLHDADTVPGHGEAVRTIGLRHDVDDNGWASVLPMARWECNRGIRSTWYFLHTAPYWQSHDLGTHMEPTLKELVEMGHEIGIHNNALAESIRTGEDPFIIFERAVTQLADWTGVPIRTTAAHGDLLCHQYGFVNYDMFLECQKNPRDWTPIVDPLSFTRFGIEYAGDWLPRAAYMSDSGGKWADYPGNPTLDDALRDFPYDGRMIVLQHPDWWPRELYLP